MTHRKFHNFKEVENRRKELRQKLTCRGYIMGVTEEQEVGREKIP